MNPFRRFQRGGPLVNQFGHVANPDPNGPSHATLQSLVSGLPGMIQGIETNRIGSVTAAPLVPRNVCNVCGKTFNLAKGAIPKPDEDKSCGDCSATLRAGYAALKAGNHYAFVKSDKFADWAGKVVEISVPVMQKLKEQFTAEWKKIDDALPPANPENPT